MILPPCFALCRQFPQILINREIGLPEGETQAHLRYRLAYTLLQTLAGRPSRRAQERAVLLSRKSMASPFLQRSVETFRRSGSSGLVWDDRFSEDMGVGKSKVEAAEFRELRHAHSVGTIGQADQRRYNDGHRLSRVNMPSPAVDPPSPKLPRFALLGIFPNPRTESLTTKESKTLRHR